MFRRPALIALSLVVLVLACEKKEPKQAAGAAKPTGRVQAPEGMTALAKGPAGFVSNKPVTVAQYLGFLQALGLPVPPRFQDVKAGSPEANAPVTGLTRAEADRYATWDMKRLPAAEEWWQASAVIGSRPYPWPAGQEPPANAEVFLVQDWVPGTDGERQAEQKKAALLDSIRQIYLADIALAQTQLKQAVDAGTANLTAQWNQVLPSFFMLLDKEKALVEARGMHERREMVGILTQIALLKGKLAAAVQTTEMTPEQLNQAVGAYEREVADARNKALQVTGDLQEATQKLQDEAVALTKEFEEAGAKAAERYYAPARQALEESSAKIESIPQAARLLEGLQKAIQDLGKSEPILQGAPSNEGIETRMVQVDKDTRELPATDPNADQIEQLRQKLDQFGGLIKREFLQEKLLFQDLDQLVALRARREGIQAKLQGLKKALEAVTVPGAGG